MTQNTRWTNMSTLKKFPMQPDFNADDEVYYPQYDSDDGIYNY